MERAGEVEPFGVHIDGNDADVHGRPFVGDGI